MGSRSEILSVAAYLILGDSGGIVYYVIVLSKLWRESPHIFPGPHAPPAVYFLEAFFMFRRQVRFIAHFLLQHRNANSLHSSS